MVFVESGQGARPHRVAPTPHQLVAQQTRLERHVAGRAEPEAGAQLAAEAAGG